jgi:hypothetical protein
VVDDLGRSFAAQALLQGEQIGGAQVVGRGRVAGVGGGILGVKLVLDVAAGAGLVGGVPLARAEHDAAALARILPAGVIVDHPQGLGAQPRVAAAAAHPGPLPGVVCVGSGASK